MPAPRDTEPRPHVVRRVPSAIAHELTKSYEAGWYVGRIKLFDVSATWRKACPSPNFLVKLTSKKETGDALDGDVEALVLATHNHGRDEWSMVPPLGQGHRRVSEA